MKKLLGLLAFSTFSSLAMANNWQLQPPLDKIVLQISAKDWVTTQTALLTVNINATLNNADLVKARADIMDKLKKVAAGEWHLTQFDRSQDSSGLEKLFVIAQTRVPQSALTSVYQVAKDISKPGETYTISDIEFKPSLEEIQQVKAKLRERLYQQVNDEINRINNTYTQQHYSVNRLYILDSDAVVQPKPYQAREMKTMVMAAAAPASAPLAVSNELVMSAMVELASNRSGGEGVANQ